MLITLESLKSLLKRDEHDGTKRQENVHIVLESIQETKRNRPSQTIRKKK